MSENQIPSVSPYIRTNWEVRTGSNLNRYVIVNSSKPELKDTTIDLSNQPNVITEGTKFTAGVMNNIENGIENVTNATINAISVINSLLESNDVNHTTTQHAVITNKIGEYEIDAATGGSWSVTNIGDANTPVFINNDGSIVAATSYDVATVAAANSLSAEINITIANSASEGESTITIQNAGESKIISLPQHPIFGELTVNGTIHGQISTAEQLSSTNIGSSSIPVYFDENGRPLPSVYSNDSSINVKSIDIGDNLIDIHDVSHINLMNRVINVNLNDKSFNLIAEVLNKITSASTVYSVTGTITESDNTYHVVKLTRGNNAYTFTVITDEGGFDEITLDSTESTVLDINIMIIRGAENDNN